jgi:hypothetical protein
VAFLPLDRILGQNGLDKPAQHFPIIAAVLPTLNTVNNVGLDRG